MTVYVDDVVAWLQGREWLVLNGYLPRYHAVLCDPPYFLGSITKRFGKTGSAPAQYGTDGVFQRQTRGFMGQVWDGFESPWHFQEWVTEWAALLLSFVHPGAVMLAFGGTRTYHRLAAGLEDAGWEVADSLIYLYGSGFPKGHRVDEAVRRNLPADAVCQCDANTYSTLHTCHEKQTGDHIGTGDVWGDDAHNLSDVLRSNYTTPDSQGDYLPDSHSGDEPPRYSQVDDQSSVPSPECAQEHTRSCERDGVRRHEPEYNPSPVQHISPQPKRDYSRPPVSLSAQSENTPLSSKYADTSESADCIRDIGPGSSSLTSRENYSSGLPCCQKCGKPMPQHWRGYNVALKPAYEPVLLARAPRNGHTYAALAREFGTGALNVDGGRIQFANNEPYSIDERCRPNTRGTRRKPSVVDYVHEIAAVNVSALGRWPANVILGCACAGDEHDADCPVRVLGEQSGERAAGSSVIGSEPSMVTNGIYGDRDRAPWQSHADTGTAARFFYTAKAAAWEREAGLGDWQRITVTDGRITPIDNAYQRGETLRRNAHPTVKPIRLTEYLARLILPPALPTPRRLLVPFAGSGSEMIGAHLAGWDVVHGIEQSADYAAIARARLAWWAQYATYEQAQSAAGADGREAAEREAARKLGVEQLGLFDGAY